jgi:hypothetical protein
VCLIYILYISNLTSDQSSRTFGRVIQAPWAANSQQERIISINRNSLDLVHGVCGIVYNSMDSLVGTGINIGE